MGDGSMGALLDDMLTMKEKVFKGCKYVMGTAFWIYFAYYMY